MNIKIEEHVLPEPGVDVLVSTIFDELFIASHIVEPSNKTHMWDIKAQVEGGELHGCMRYSQVPVEEEDRWVALTDLVGLFKTHTEENAMAEPETHNKLGHRVADLEERVRKLENAFNPLDLTKDNLGTGDGGVPIYPRPFSYPYPHDPVVLYGVRPTNYRGIPEYTTISSTDNSDQKPNK